MSEFAGTAFFLALAAAAFFGLRILSRERVSTEEEFERNASEVSTGLGISVRAIQGLIDPAEGRAEQVISELKEGRYNRSAAAGDKPEPGRGNAGREN